MPLAGLTAFGFKEGNGIGLTGHFYDLKQTADRKPTNVLNKDALVKEVLWFFKSGWNEEVLKKYFMAKDPLSTVQIFIPVIPSLQAPKAFKVENEVKAVNWAALYKGSVTASRDVTFRFRRRRDNLLAVRFGQRNVFFNSLQDFVPLDIFPGNQPKVSDRSILSYGSWIHLEIGKKYPIEILLSDYGGACSYVLCIEEEHPEIPYPVNQGKTHSIIYPLFQLRKDVPLPEYKKDMDLVKPGVLPEVTTNQNIFTR